MIVPIWKTETEKIGVLECVSSVERTLKSAGIRVKVDVSEQRTPGWKFNFWEMKVVYVDLLKFSFVVRYSSKINFFGKM